MKKCDIKGCKRKAEYFTPAFSYCFIHWKELVREAAKGIPKNFAPINSFSVKRERLTTEKSVSSDS